MLEEQLASLEARFQVNAVVVAPCVQQLDGGEGVTDCVGCEVPTTQYSGNVERRVVERHAIVIDEDQKPLA